LVRTAAVSPLRQTDVASLPSSSWAGVKTVVRRSDATVLIRDFIHSMMPRETTTVPDDLARLVEGAVDAGVFQNKSDAMRHALREYFKENENTRVSAAVRLYDAGDVSLGGAARLADVSRFEMHEILREEGVELRLGSATEDDAEQEIETARDL